MLYVVVLIWYYSGTSHPVLLKAYEDETACEIKAASERVKHPDAVVSCESVGKP